MLSWFKSKLKEMIREAVKEVRQEELEENIKMHRKLYKEVFEEMMEEAKNEERKEKITEHLVEIAGEDAVRELDEDAQKIGEVIDNVEEPEDDSLSREVEEEEEEPIVVVLPEEPEPVYEGKPYTYINMSGNMLTVILVSGEKVVSNEGTKALYTKVTECTTEDEVRVLLIPGYLQMKENEKAKKIKELEAEERNKREKEKENKKVEEIKSSFQKLLATGDFEVKDDSVYVKGIDRTLPPLLLEKFSSIADQKDSVEYTSLLRFWYWCCLNPRAEVANMLYGFLQKNHMRLNAQGFFYALRNVVKKGTDTTLVDFVSSTYNHVKGTWKKNTAHYEVFRNDDGSYVFYKIGNYGGSAELVGNLKELYTNIAKLDQNRYTDQYTESFDIRIGRVVNMKPEDCNWSTTDCGHAGLHFTLNEINQVGCGDTTILVLINPMKVVAIGSQKGRCWEYLPIMTIPSHEEGKAILRDKAFDTLELDEWYAKEELDQLEQKVAEGFTKENQRFRYTNTKVTDGEALVMVDRLTKIRGEIDKKVVEVS